MPRFRERKRKAFLELARQAIYEGILAVIKEHGYDGLTMQRVASAADIATGTLYNYFKNKDELLIYADRKMRLQFLELFEEVNELDISAKEKVFKLVDGVFGFAQEHAEVFVALDQANILSKISKQEMRDSHEQFESAFVTIIQKGIEEKRFRQVDPIVTSELFSATMRGILCQKIEMETLDPRADMQKVLDLFFYYLGCAET